MKKNKQFDLYLWQVGDTVPSKVDLPKTAEGVAYWPSEHRKPFLLKIPID